MAVVIKVGETEAVSVGIGEKVYIQGDPGFSPTIEVTDITGGHRLTITDINGDKTVDVMNGAKGDTGATGPTGQPGQTGATPDISIGTVTTGAAGSQADATMTGTPEQPVLNLTIPRGDPGEVTQAEFDDLAEEVSQQKSAIEDLEALTNRKAGMLVDSASGAIASFVPDATIDNLLGVSVDIEPQQDLHGYENPWPAGGGKNKFAVPSGLPITSKGITLFYDGYHYVVTGTATGTVRTQELALDLAVGVYILSANQTSDKTRVVLYKNGTLTRSQAKNDAAYSFNVESGDVITCGLQILSSAENCTIEPQIESGSTATTYAPYSNECPISGWDSVEVEADGINIWDEQWEAGRYNPTTGAPTTGESGIRSKNFLRVLAGTTIYIYCGTAITNDFRILYYDKYKSFLYASPWTNRGVTVTVPTNAAYIKFYLAGGVYGNTYKNDISINYPSTDHDYHPYSGNRYTIALGNTVYGGTLDATNGILTVDRVSTIITDTTPVTFDYANRRAIYSASRFPYSPLPSGKIISNIFATEATAVSTPRPWMVSLFNNGSIIFGFGDTIATSADWLAFIRNHLTQVVYEVAEPIVITLDPVTISTISGQTNNVWADAGDVAVEYAADLKHYIDSKIAAAVAALS